MQNRVPQAREASLNTVHLRRCDYGWAEANGDGRVVSWAKGEVAHLAFYTTRVPSMAAGDDAFLENFVNGFAMKDFSAPRGE